WVNLSGAKRQELNTLFSMNRRLLKAYLLKESLERLWFYRYEGAVLRYLQKWIDQLRWQRLRPFEKSRRDSQLLPNQGAAGRRRSGQRQHQGPVTSWPRI